MVMVTNKMEAATNWEDALELAETRTNVADIVLFFTDGNPTLYNDPSGNNGLGGNCFSAAAQNVQDAIDFANDIKNSPNGTKLFTIAVGGVNITNIQRITGGESLNLSSNPTNFNTADYIFTSNFSGLASAFASVAEELCGTDLLLTKGTTGGSTCLNSTVSFTLEVENIGSDNNAGDVLVTDNFPLGYTNVSYNGGESVTITGNNLSWDAGQLAPGESKTITVTADIISTSASALTNTATATASNADEVTSTVQGSSITVYDINIDNIQFHSLSSSYSDINIVDGNTYDLGSLGSI